MLLSMVDELYRDGDLPSVSVSVGDTEMLLSALCSSDGACSGVCVWVQLCGCEGVAQVCMLV